MIYKMILVSEWHVDCNTVCVTFARPLVDMCGNVTIKHKHIIIPTSKNRYELQKATANVISTS